MHQPAKQSSSEFDSLFDQAEAILLAQMPEPIARAIIDLARRGARAPHAEIPQRTASSVRVPDQEPQFVTTREAAEQLRVSDKQIYRLVERGRLRRYGVGRGHRFQQSDIAALLLEQQSAAVRVRAARRAADERRVA